MTAPMREVSIVGLPGSGKTTLLAALWHLVQSREIETRLKFGSLRDGDFTHLNEIAKVWRSAHAQERTQTTGMHTVSMNLIDQGGRPLRVSFPDVPGEEFRGMWEDRRIDKDLAAIVSRGGLLLMVNGNKIAAPAWAMERAVLSRTIGTSLPSGTPKDWEPADAPTQVQLVDMLQMFRQHPLDCGPRRLAVMISAWDKARGEALEPATFLEKKLPLLEQYLSSGRDDWAWRVFGVSAQGGEYDGSKPDAPPSKEAEQLRDLDLPSKRIVVVDGKEETHDLTGPLEWLIQ